MTFNPQDILSKIRRKEITPSKTFQVNNDISEKKGHFASRSSSSSGNIFPQNFEQPPVDNEYIGNLLKKIQSLENKVNSLELELVESKKQTNLLKIEKVHLENQVRNFFLSDGNNFL